MNPIKYTNPSDQLGKRPTHRPLKLLALISLITYLFMIVLNALANILPINGKMTGAISDYYANLFAPVGFTFSIWGIIYLFLLMFSAYLFIAGHFSKGAIYTILPRITKIFILSSLANSLWILSWHYDLIWLSLILMVVILICLIQINGPMRLVTLTKVDYLFVRLPFSIYFGWITVATVANVITFLVSIEWHGFGISEVFWMDLVLLVAGLIGAYSIWYYRNLAYGLTLVWAFYGILYKHLSPLGFNRAYPSVIVTTLVMMVLFVATMVFHYRVHKPSFINLSTEK